MAVFHLVDGGREVSKLGSFVFIDPHTLGPQVLTHFAGLRLTARGQPAVGVLVPGPGVLGLRVPEHPTTDIFRLKPDELPAYLVEDLGVLARYVPDPDGPDFLDFLVNDYHEMSSFARLAWERPYDPSLPRWLHRISVPTLLLYGDKDRLTPAQQSKTWAGLIPNAVVRTPCRTAPLARHKGEGRQHQMLVHARVRETTQARKIGKQIFLRLFGADLESRFTEVLISLPA